MKRSEVKKAQQRAADMFAKAGIVLTPQELDRIEMADFGSRNSNARTGMVTYVNNDAIAPRNDAVSATNVSGDKHPPVGDEPGKMETFRCRWGKVYAVCGGRPARPARPRVPAGSEAYYTVFHEIELNPGEQYTIPPDMLHWFQAGDEGAIVSEFSSTSRDEFDIFTDPRIMRIPQIEEDE